MVMLRCSPSVEIAMGVVHGVPVRVLVMTGRMSAVYVRGMTGQRHGERQEQLYDSTCGMAEDGTRGCRKPIASMCVSIAVHLGPRSCFEAWMNRRGSRHGVTSMPSQSAHR